MINFYFYKLNKKIKNMSWYFFALLSLGLYSIQGILLKYAAIKDCDKEITTLYFLFTVAIISFPLLFLKGSLEITILGLIWAVINGIFYCIQLMTRIGALKFVPASIVYPIIRLNIAVVVLILILILKEKITLLNSTGIVLAVISLYLLSKGEKK